MFRRRLRPAVEPHPINASDENHDQQGSQRGNPWPGRQRDSPLSARCQSRRFLRGDYFRGIQFLATAFLVRNLGLCYRRDKPISFARYCLYEDWILGIIP